jgi:hypothetical protein
MHRHDVVKLQHLPIVNATHIALAAKRIDGVNTTLQS